MKFASFTGKMRSLESAQELEEGAKEDPPLSSSPEMPLALIRCVGATSTKRCRRSTNYG